MALTLTQRESPIAVIFEQAQISPSPPAHFRRDPREEVFSADRFAGILTHCTAKDISLDEEMRRHRMFSLKLDLRAIKELERMAELVMEEDFGELLFFPKMKEFFAKTQHDENEKQAFWLMVRIRYLACLSPLQRASVIQAKDQAWGNPALMLAELFKLPELKDRLSLVSRLSYREFAALMKEMEKRKLSLEAGGEEFLRSTSTQEQKSQQPAGRAWLAVGG